MVYLANPGHNPTRKKTLVSKSHPVKPPLTNQNNGQNPTVTDHFTHKIERYEIKLTFLFLDEKNYIIKIINNRL